MLRAQRALLSRTPQDAIPAVALFRQAASRTDPAAPLAQYDLAWCYEDGIGVQADPHQARALYLRAAVEAREPTLRDLAQAGRGAWRARRPLPTGLRLFWPAARR